MITRRCFIKSCPLVVVLGPYSPTSSAGSSLTEDTWLQGLWLLGDQVFSFDPELAKSLAVNMGDARWRAIAKRLIHKQGGEKLPLNCIKFDPRAVSIFAGWVLPTDLLKLAVAVRKQLGSIA